MPFFHGDIVNVSIADHMVRQMNSGTWAIQLRFVHEEKGDIDGFVWLTAKCAGQIRKFLRAVDLDPDTTDVAKLDPDSPEPISIVGKTLQIEVAEEEYKGKKSIKVKYINAPKRNKAEPEVQEFFKKLNTAIKAAKSHENGDKEPGLTDEELGDNLVPTF